MEITWKNYVEELFSGQKTEQQIMQIESILSINEGKASGTVEFQSEINKVFNEDSKKELSIIFNEIYNSTKIPRQWL